MTRPPNILWIVTTQWRAQACGYSGDSNARTPRLDAMAAESVNFTQAVTSHPFGPFARAALLTGIPSPENGLRDYFDPLPFGARTVAHDLGDRGYSTAFFGKWHLAKRDPAAPLVGEAHARAVVPPESRGGFAFWEGFESGFLLNDPWLHGTRLPGPTRFEGYQSDILSARAAGWIRRSPADSPWFCFVSLEAPHPPYDAPAPGPAPLDPRQIILPANVPRGGDIEAKARTELAGYYAHIAATDLALGHLLDAAPDALVVFTSAHGDMHGAHGLFRKGWPYEESVRVPLLVRAPSPKDESNPSSPKPGASDAAVSLLDLRAMTLAAAAGKNWEPKKNLAAISMPSVVQLPWQCDRIWRGARTRTRKLALNADGTPWLFFDLENDPGETKNLASNPSRAAEIRELAGRL